MYTNIQIYMYTNGTQLAIIQIYKWQMVIGNNPTFAAFDSLQHLIQQGAIKPIIKQMRMGVDIVHWTQSYFRKLAIFPTLQHLIQQHAL